MSGSAKNLGLSYFLLSPKKYSKEWSWHMDQTYQFWHQIWQKSLSQIDPEAKVFSDDFTRADQVGVLYYGNEPITLCLYTKHNLFNAQSVQDSYFKAWPKEVFEELKAQGHSEALICSHYTMALKRRSVGEFRLKEIVTAMINCVFQGSDAPILLATTRNSKGVNKMMYSIGCKPIAQNVVYHGEPADMMILHKQEGLHNLMITTAPGLRDLALELWENRNTVSFQTERLASQEGI
jgi:hypothetical protein